jgi:hypothetical protein
VNPERAIDRLPHIDWLPHRERAEVENELSARADPLKGEEETPPKIRELSIAFNIVLRVVVVLLNVGVAAAHHHRPPPTTTTTVPPTSTTTGSSTATSTFISYHDYPCNGYTSQSECLTHTTQA